ncbi:MAG: NADPH:quinone oxidoreductase family protein [Sandaracinaceae bacterium]
MKALVCKELTGPEALVVEEVPDPRVGRGDARIRVMASGVNYPDVLITRGGYQFQPPAPFIPGGEVAGVVEAVGEGVTEVAVGDRVCGTTLVGGHAELVSLPADRLVPLPEEVPFEAGAGLLFTYGTMIHAYEDRARLRAGESVLVLGAGGGVGTAAVQLAKAMGAGPVVAAASGAKLEACREAGADEVIDYTAEDLKARAKALTGGGADVVVDPVGGPYAEPALRATAWEGRYLVIGFAAGDIPRIPLNLVLLKGCAVVGVFWGQFTERDKPRTREQLTRLGRWVAEGKLRPLVSATYPLVEGRRAILDLAERRATGKVVILPAA